MVTKVFERFFNSEKAGGFILIGCTILSILLANSSIGDTYTHFWHIDIAGHPLEYWINDGLMTIFFVLVGLEIERELYVGELSSPKKAILPLFAAIGGMAIPALIHFLLNKGTPAQAGFGIPMATDIAFALGVLSLLGNKVPASLKIFLTAFAIIDDLGAILIIAVAYTTTISFVYLGIALAIFGGLLIMNRLKVHLLIAYIIPGIAMWYCMLQSGVHATISGILFAFSLPFGKGDEASPSYRLQHFLHKPVSFGILSIFALANTGIIFGTGWHQQLATGNSLGILAGLVLGKPAGILLFSFLAIRSGISSLPDDLKWRHLLGAAVLGGIGFTMSIFITLLAFTDAAAIVGSKIAVLLASCIAGLAGYLLLIQRKPQ